MSHIIAALRNQVQKIKCRIANLTNRIVYLETNCCNGGGDGVQSIQDGNGTDIDNTDPNNPIINILEVSDTESGIVNNTPLQELGGVDKLINGVRIGRGSGNNEDNVIVGKDALSTNTTGTYNTAFGGWALTENTTGSFNSSFGSGALYSNTTGIYNNAFGTSTLQNNTTGSRNVGVGTSLFWNSTGQENTGVGSNAGYGATTGSQNTYIGNQAGYNNGIGSYNTAIGSRAMITSGTGIPASTLDMNRNVFIGAGLTLADGVNDVLAIDNKGATNTFYSNALLYGNFADRFLRINGRFEIAPSTMPTPDVNFNKKLVYNPTDGKVTAVDDTSGEGEKGEKGDQGDNGWSPKFVFEEDGTQRLVKKLDSWIGGTGTAPTDNVGMYVTNGGYTSDKSLATNFKGAEGTANGVVEEGNIQAVSGGEVYDKVVIKESATLKNAVLNPNFVDGAQNWRTFRSTIITDATYLTVRKVGTLNVSAIRQTSFNLNHLYYVQFKVRVTSDNSTRIRFGFNGNWSDINLPIKDKWYEVKEVIEVVREAEGTTFQIQAYYPSEVEGLDKEFEIDKEWGVVLIDLTDYFGAGNEPTAEQMVYLANSLPEQRIGNSLYLENKFFELRDNTPQKLETLSSLFQQLLSVQDNLTEELSWERVKTYFEPVEEYKNRFGDYPDPLVFYDGTPVADASDWELRKLEIRNKWMDIMGEWPELITNQEFTIISTVDKGDYIEHKVSFEWLPGVLTEGYLLVPCGCNGGLLPASISVYYDPETSAGITGEAGIRDFSVQLVRKGFISLAIGAGFNYYNNWRYPNSTTPTIQPLSLRAYAAANAWHALANYQNVDSTRIGIVGHSYGGKWAQFASCLFDKFALGVWSDGGVVLEASDYEISYYLGLSTPDYPDGAYNFLLSEGHDFSELHSLMDGRPFLVSAGDADRENRWLSLNYNVVANEFLGRDKSIALTMREGHPPTHESNKELVNFFEHYLKFKGK